MSASIIQISQQRQNIINVGIRSANSHIHSCGGVAEDTIAEAFAHMLAVIMLTSRTVEANLVEVVITVTEAKEEFIEMLRSRNDWTRHTTEQQRAIIYEVEVASFYFERYLEMLQNIPDLEVENEGLLQAGEADGLPVEPPAVSDPASAPAIATVPSPAVPLVPASVSAPAAPPVAPAPQISPVQANGIGRNTPGAEKSYWCRELGCGHRRKTSRDMRAHYRKFHGVPNLNMSGWVHTWGISMLKGRRRG